MKKQIIEAVERLGCLRYFPADAGARQAIMELFDRMIEKPEQLHWLVITLIDEVGEWPGPTEVRGIFCNRFRPKDGKEGYSTIGRFSAEANETLSIAEGNERKALEALHAPRQLGPAPPR